MKLTKLITLAALFSNSNASITDWIFGGDENDGMIEMDIDIKPNDSKHIPASGKYLLDLAEDDDELYYVEKKLNNFFNTQITSKLHFGSEKKPFNLIFDSGSSWVWVSHKLCADCGETNEGFDSFASDSYKQYSKHLSYLKYGRGMVFGYNSHDQVCLNGDQNGKSCMPEYLFKSVVHERDLDGLQASGIVGLAPSSEISKAQLFIPSLYKAGAIKKNLFAMYIDPNGSSKMQVGGYNLKKYANPGAELKCYPIQKDHHYW